VRKPGKNLVIIKLQKKNNYILLVCTQQSLSYSSMSA